MLLLGLDESCTTNWLGVLKNDKRAIFTAASKAQQAAHWLMAAQDGPRKASPISTALCARNPYVKGPPKIPIQL